MMSECETLHKLEERTPYAAENEAFLNIPKMPAFPKD